MRLAQQARGDDQQVPGYIVTYVRAVDYVSTKFGRLAMYAIFLMIGVLLLDAITRNLLKIPLHWCIEMAQFTMTAYYIVGGAYSIQLNSHVRMDLLYDRWKPRTKAKVDAFTSLFLVVYLVCLLIGSISSTMYAIEYNERKFSMWNPSMVPIKMIMVFGIFLMLLQSISTFFKDLAKGRGIELS